MADVCTNRGAYLFQIQKWRNQWQDKDGAVVSKPVNFYVALCQASPPPTKTTNLLSQLTQVSGGGYPNGGYAVPVGTAGFPSIVEDDVLNKSVATMIDVLVTAAGGSIGPFGWVVLLDDRITVANRQVLGAWQVSPDVTIADGATKVLQAGKLEDAPF